MSFFFIDNISNTPTLNAGLLIKNGNTGAGFIEIYEDSDDGTQKVKIQVPATLSSDYTLTLPTNLGTNNQFLKNNGSGVLSWISNTVSSLAADNLTTADSSVSIEANDSSISIGAAANTGAINIGTGSAARTITIGNVSAGGPPPHEGATINLNSGTGGIALASTGTGDITINSDDTLLLDADGVLELNSSAGAISIGNANNAEAINIGTGGARTITMGNTTGATALNLNSGTGGIALASTGTGDITINSAQTLQLDADGVLELNSSAGAISIGNANNAEAINIGTGDAARTITIGNTTTALNLNSGTAGTIITGKVGIGASGLNLNDSDFSNLNIIAQVPKIKLVDNRSNYGSADDVELGAIEFWSYDTSPASNPPGGIVGKIHITSDSSEAYVEGKLKFATAGNGSSEDYMIIDSVGRIKSVNDGGFVNSHITVQTNNVDIDLTDKQKKGNFTLYIDVELNTSNKDIKLPDAIADNVGLTIKIIFNVSSDISIDVNIGVADGGSTTINGIIRLFRDDDIDMLTFESKKKIILDSNNVFKAGGSAGSIYTFHYYAINKIYAECEGIINNNSSGALTLLNGFATSTVGIS